MGTTCSYTPDAGFTGGDSFDYQIDDGHGGSARASVTVTVAVNRPPVALDDIGEAHGTGDTAIDVTANDRDPEGDGLGVSLLTDPAYGRAQCFGGACLYLPPAISPEVRASSRSTTASRTALTMGTVGPPRPRSS